MFIPFSRLDSCHPYPSRSIRLTGRQFSPLSSTLFIKFRCKFLHSSICSIILALFFHYSSTILPLFFHYSSTNLPPIFLSLSSQTSSAQMVSPEAPFEPRAHAPAGTAGTALDLPFLKDRDHRDHRDHCHSYYNRYMIYDIWYMYICIYVCRYHRYS